GVDAQCTRARRWARVDVFTGAPPLSWEAAILTTVRPVITEMTIEEAGRVFTDPAAYADEPRFYAACALLRREAPVHHVDAEGFYPFYAVTKHADVMEVERQHDKWLNAPRPLLGAKEGDDQRAATGDVLRTLIHMDAPDHPVYRQIAADWFLPKSLSRLDERI